MSVGILGILATSSVFILPLLVIVVLNLLKSDTAKSISLTCGLGVAICQMVAAVTSWLIIFRNKQDYIDFSVFWDMAVEGAPKFSIDLFSAIVLFTIGLVIFIAILVAQKTVVEKKVSFVSLLMVAVLGMNGMVLVRDLFSLYVFLEITSIASFVLIALNKDQKGLGAAVKYLIMSAVATVFLLISLSLLYMGVESLEFTRVAVAFKNGNFFINHNFIMIALIMFTAAFALKAGLVPFHGWVGEAYGNAPDAVSVFLGGIATKVVGVYGIIRILNMVIPHNSGLETAFSLLALMSILVGAFGAFAQKEFKKVLAYSSISQIGYIILGAATGSPLGFVGAIWHFFNHATFKSLLFVNASAVRQSTGVTKIEEMGGLGKQMPLTATASVLAFFSAAGIPPLAGFWSKLLIIIAVWQEGNYLFAGIALIASVLTIAYFLRLQSKIFFGESQDKFADVQDVKGGMALATVILSAIIVIVGIVFPWVLKFLAAQGLL